MAGFDGYSVEDAEEATPLGDGSPLLLDEDDHRASLFSGYRTEESKQLFLITAEQFSVYRAADERGTANPSIMSNPFWKYMIFEGIPAWSARTAFSASPEVTFELDRPVWSFRRWGATRTRIPDGRMICIGGEHEDFYDPDFCIHNGQCLWLPKSVLWVNRNGRRGCHCISTITWVWCPSLAEARAYHNLWVSHLHLNKKSFVLRTDVHRSYPTAIFPPTDFHTATYYVDPKTKQESIYIVGGLGYHDSPSREKTEVYRLDLTDFRIQLIPTSGAGPQIGTSEHRASLVEGDGGQGPIIEIITKDEKRYLLRLEDMKWTERKNWFDRYIEECTKVVLLLRQRVINSAHPVGVFLKALMAGIPDRNDHWMSSAHLAPKLFSTSPRPHWDTVQSVVHLSECIHTTVYPLSIPRIVSDASSPRLLALASSTRNR